MVAKCPPTNTAVVEEDDFLLNVDSKAGLQPHEIGWLISGAAAAVAVVLALYNVGCHALTYTRPLEQRQIIRILLFAPVYAVVSFCGYRWFRQYEYFELGEAVMEAVAISAFLMLLLQYIGDAVEDQRAVFSRKEKTKMPFPFCCWRYRPSKAYFLVLLKWSVLQYVIVRPLLSAAGIVLQYFDLLCTQTYSWQYGEVYIAAVDFASISIALYGLFALYELLKEDLRGRKPLSKFLTIKLAIFFTFYQGFVFGVLQDHGVLKPTQYWTSTNIANGLNALCTSLEMVIVAVWQLFAFPSSEYTLEHLAKPRKHKIKTKKHGKKDAGAADDDDESHGLKMAQMNHDEKTAIAQEGAPPGQHMASTYSEQYGTAGTANTLVGTMPLSNGSFMTAHARPGMTARPSYQQQAQEPRLLGESHVIPGTSVGRTNAKGHTNVLRSLLHALNMTDFLVELWHSCRFAIDRMRGKAYTREDMRFGMGKFDFAVFQSTAVGAGLGMAGGLQRPGSEVHADGRKPLQISSPTLVSGPARVAVPSYDTEPASTFGPESSTNTNVNVGGMPYNPSFHSGSVASGNGNAPGPSSLQRLMMPSAALGAAPEIGPSTGTTTSAPQQHSAGGGSPSLPSGPGTYQALHPVDASAAALASQGQGYAHSPGYGQSYAAHPYASPTHSSPQATQSSYYSPAAESSRPAGGAAGAAGLSAGSPATGFYKRNTAGDKVEIGKITGLPAIVVGGETGPSQPAGPSSRAMPQGLGLSAVPLGTSAALSNAAPSQAYGQRPESALSASVYSDDRDYDTATATLSDHGAAGPEGSGGAPRAEVAIGGGQGYGVDASSRYHPVAGEAGYSRGLPQFQVHPPAQSHPQGQAAYGQALAGREQGMGPQQQQQRQQLWELQRAMALTPSAQGHGSNVANNLSSGLSDTGLSSQRSSAYLAESGPGAGVGAGNVVEFDEYGRPRSWEPQAF